MHKTDSLFRYYSYQ